MPKSEKPHRCTLQDIAERTGFTVNTVSRALKDKSDISVATREQIKAIADEMGYIRNRAASSLRSGRTKTIGVIVGGMSNPYYGIMTDAIQNAASELGYSLQIFCSRDKADLESQAVETALSNQVDGIVLFPCAGSGSTIRRMKAVGIPYVLMARHLASDEDDYVVCDDEQGGYLAARHLIEAGHTRLGFLSTFDVVYSSESRQRGFYRALAEAGLPRENGLYAHCPTTQDAREQLERWRLIGVTGVFVFCDEEAWCAVSLLQAQGRSIPRDMAIVGFDNIQGTLPIPAPLCSVDYDISQMARSGIELIRRRIHEPDLPPQHVVYPPRMVCRGSCGSKKCPDASAQIPDIYSYLR
ncbi:MAG: LacI family DNA-binding transcriptional regulator [Clostridia bacterium]|nr:LacI family DNA-binding transcriptional regulator [Clostridia bacterium]